MLFLIRYYKEKTQLVGLFFTTGALDKYTKKEFLKVPF